MSQYHQIRMRQYFEGGGGRCDGNAVLTTSGVDLGDFADGCWDSADLNGAIVATAVVAHFLRF
jgi:hypothetical protein